MVVLFTLLKYCILPKWRFVASTRRFSTSYANKFPYIGFFVKSRLSAIDKYVHRGFINHIDRITEV